MATPHLDALLNEPRPEVPTERFTGEDQPDFSQRKTEAKEAQAEWDKAQRSSQNDAFMRNAPQGGGGGTDLSGIMAPMAQFGSPQINVQPQPIFTPLNMLENPAAFPVLQQPQSMQLPGGPLQTVSSQSTVADPTRDFTPLMTQVGNTIANAANPANFISQNAGSSGLRNNTQAQPQQPVAQPQPQMQAPSVPSATAGPQAQEYGASPSLAQNPMLGDPSRMSLAQQVRGDFDKGVLNDSTMSAWQGLGAPGMIANATAEEIASRETNTFDGKALDRPSSQKVTNYPGIGEAQRKVIETFIPQNPLEQAAYQSAQNVAALKKMQHIEELDQMRLLRQEIDGSRESERMAQSKIKDYELAAKETRKAAAEEGKKLDKASRSQEKEALKRIVNTLNRDADRMEAEAKQIRQAEIKASKDRQRKSDLAMKQEARLKKTFAELPDHIRVPELAGALELSEMREKGIEQYQKDVATGTGKELDSLRYSQNHNVDVIRALVGKDVPVYAGEGTFKLIAENGIPDILGSPGVATPFSLTLEKNGSLSVNGNEIAPEQRLEILNSILGSELGIEIDRAIGTAIQQRGTVMRAMAQYLPPGGIEEIQAAAPDMSLGDIWADVEDKAKKQGMSLPQAIVSIYANFKAMQGQMQQAAPATNAAPGMGM